MAKEREIQIHVDKLYRYDLKQEAMNVAIPFPKGELKSVDGLRVMDKDQALRVQSKATAKYEDGSVKYAFVRFMGDLEGNKKKDFTLIDDASIKAEGSAIKLEESDGKISLDTGAVSFTLANDSDSVFESLSYDGRIYDKSTFRGPVLSLENDVECGFKIIDWKVVETGSVCTILEARGYHSKDKNSQNQDYAFTFRITAYAGKEYLDLAYRIFNTSDEELFIKSLVFYINSGDGEISKKIGHVDFEALPDSTGCGDGEVDFRTSTGSVIHTRGTKDLPEIEKIVGHDGIRTFSGISNYKTDFYIGKDGAEVNEVADVNLLVGQANEHISEVHYGTFMADRTDKEGGITATVFQAQQNFPKAIKANENGVAIMLVPEGVGKIVMQSGMAREQRFMLHFHKACEPIAELDNRSLIYQTPIRPSVDAKLFDDAKVMPEIFSKIYDPAVEMLLIGMGDAHARCYGMLNFGDSWDAHYTEQGRGNGSIVWSNNEYDYIHSCAMMYARTGIRRFLDYLLVSGSHVMDVDVCHYSKDPNRVGGEWEHTAGHCKNGIMVCSHEWVEGLLDLYHFSGDERAFETAIGVGNNILRLLDLPMYQVPGEANARETGWALRALVALYVETHDEKWLPKCGWIIDSFKKWDEDYGVWLSPYTDNTSIRVGFMISVAIGSVMRYYREFPSDDIKDMILRNVDDLIENAILDCGLFYYKELPSLQRLGNNNLLLESLTIAYELSGNPDYLKYGLTTFRRALDENVGGAGDGKLRIVEDTVLGNNNGTKRFAQSFLPLITYYNALAENGIKY